MIKSISLRIFHILLLLVLRILKMWMFVFFALRAISGKIILTVQPSVINLKAAGRANLLQRIRSSIDTFSAQQIYQSMITAIFTYCGYISLGWSEFRKCVIFDF